jgi:histidinol-phosphate aminotransferase
MSAGDNPTPWIRRNLQNIPHWNPTASDPDAALRKIHRMDLNESPYPPSQKVIEAVARHAEKINRYPDGGCPDLAARLADRTGVPASRICFGSGSTELISNVVQSAVGPGEGVVACTPLWRRFAGVFQVADAEATLVPSGADGRVDVDAVLRAIGNNTRMVICVTPSNPTGLALTEPELRRMVEQTPDNVLLYIDEAYHEFAVHAGFPDALEIVKDRKAPWIVTRTFSKAYSLAGLRLGYALCGSQEIADAIRLLSSTFNVSAFAEVSAMAALDDPDYTRFLLDKNAEERTRTIAGMEALGLAPLPSVTNFISCDVGVAGIEVAKRMRERGVRIATWGEPQFPNYIRVSVGLPDDTDAFLAALREVLEEMRRDGVRGAA